MLWLPVKVDNASSAWTRIQTIQISIHSSHSTLYSLACTIHHLLVDELLGDEDQPVGGGGSFALVVSTSSRTKVLWYVVEHFCLALKRPVLRGSTHLNLNLVTS